MTMETLTSAQASPGEEPGGAQGEVPADVAAIREARARWEAGTVAKVVARSPLRQPRFTTLSDLEVPDVVTPADAARRLPARPRPARASIPFTRGVQPTMYRGRLWTMRMFAGFGTPEQTNERFKYLLAQGQTGLSTAFDFPTLMGYDSDSPRSLGEVGMCGVAVDTLRDMEMLFDGHPARQGHHVDDHQRSGHRAARASTSRSPTSAASRAAAIGGTVQNDCLKEFIAQHAWLVPPRPAMRIVTDMIEFCATEVPRWNTVSHQRLSHPRGRQRPPRRSSRSRSPTASPTCRAASSAGLDVDGFAPRLSFFFDVHNDFFEEIAKFRAARRIWARVMKERFGAKKPESMKLRTHAQTAGVSLTAQQPYNNVVRVALQALAAVLGGTQSLHTNSPRRDLRAAHRGGGHHRAAHAADHRATRRGVANTIDPLGGSYFVEWMTDEARGRGARLHPPHRRHGRHGRRRSRRATRSGRSPRRPIASSARSSAASA